MSAQRATALTPRATAPLPVPRPRSPRLSIAPSPVRGLYRHRLDPAAATALQVRLTVIVAPAGAGKTTLLEHWASAWMDSRDATVAWLHRGRDALLARAQKALTEALYVPAAADLDDALSGSRTPVVLILDEVTDVESEDFEDWIARAPAALHVVVAGRRPPAYNLARRELTSQVLTSDDLRFRTEETEALFRRVYDAPLAPTDAADVTRHAGGWAAALHLFQPHVAATSPAARSRVVRALGGRVRYARDYLHHLLNSLDQDLRGFLLETAPLELLTPQRCDRLLTETDSYRLLTRLEHLFSLVSTPDAGATYVVHPVLRAHLLTEAREQWGDAETDRRLQRAAQVLFDDGEADAAFRTLAICHEPAALLAAAEASGVAVLGLRHTDWVERLAPRVVAASPWLLLTRAVRRLREGRLQAAAADARRAATDCPPSGRVLATRMEQEALAWLGQDGGAGRSWPMQLHLSVTRPAELLSTVRGGRPEEVLLRAVARAVSGDLVGARRDLAGCHEALDGHPFAVLVAGTLRLALHPAELADGDHLAQQAEDAGFPWFAVLGRALAAAGQQLASPTKGEDPLSRAVAAADRAGDDWGAALMAAVRCGVHLARRQPDVAALEDLCSRFRWLRSPALESWARAALALASAAAGLPEAEAEAQAAASFAFSCQVQGALPVAHVAAALARPDRSAELLGLARTEAADAGFDASPWAWVAPRRAPAGVGWTTPLMLRCLGRFELTVDGRTPALNQVRPRAREVLRLLAAHAGRSVHRDTILEALWPGLDPEAATHNLHVAVSSLRTMLEPGVPRGASRLLLRHGERYQLALPTGASCDLVEFDEAVDAATRARTAGDLPTAIARWERALGLYRGDLLADEPDGEWVEPLRERYRLRAAEAAGLLGRARLRADDAAGAADAAARSLEIDPYRDASWRTLLAAYTTLGDLVAAERTRISYAAVLADLGIEA